MAESRVLQKKFGSTGGTTEFGQFGSLAEGAANTTKDLNIIQSLDTFLRGWYGATASGSEPPRIEDMNGLFYLIFSQLRYILEKGIPEWLNSSEQRYYANVSYVSRNGAIYLAILGDDSTNINAQRDPATETTFWRKLISAQGAVNLDGNQTVAGVKTLTSIPVLPASSPSSDNQATRKKYVDDLDAQNVKITGNQTVGGIKTHTSIPILPGSNPTSDNQATRKAYVDSADAVLASGISGNTSDIAEIVQSVESFDYVIDSDSKLVALLSGITGVENVLVRSGTWDGGSRLWDLDSTGTKRIVGEAGSKIVLGNSVVGIYHGSITSDEQIDASEYSITGLGLSVSPLGGTCYGFNNCANITNCSVEVLGSGAVNTYGFDSCNNLINCKALTSGGSTLTSGFYRCEKLINCRYVLDVSSGPSICGFLSCVNLSCCYISVVSIPASSVFTGFSGCKYLSSCSCVAALSTSNDLIGFATCLHISSCISEAVQSATGDANAFYDCDYVSACRALGSNLGAGAGYAFNLCNFVYGCFANGDTADYLNTNGVNTNSVLS